MQRLYKEILKHKEDKPAIRKKWAKDLRGHFIKARGLATGIWNDTQHYSPSDVQVLLVGM